MPCEDFPCCGHGPSPTGDGGGCPDVEGRYKCVLCGTTLPRGVTSSICNNSHPAEDDYDNDPDYDYR